VGEFFDVRTTANQRRSDRGMVMEVHLSVATIEALNKILRTCRNLRQVIGREPTPEEIAGRLGMPSKTIRKLLGYSLLK
jgi:RNA polymerase primary sigma factor